MQQTRWKQRFENLDAYYDTSYLPMINSGYLAVLPLLIRIGSGSHVIYPCLTLEYRMTDPPAEYDLVDFCYQFDAIKINQTCTEARVHPDPQRLPKDHHNARRIPPT